MPQPSYLSDLAPADFFLFPKPKTLMKGKRFATIEEIKGAVGDTNKRVSELFRGLVKKTLALVYYTLGGGGLL